MTKTVNIPISRLSVKSVIQEINKHAEGKNLVGVFFNETSLLKGTLEIRTAEPEVVRVKEMVSRPVKRDNAKSQYYCVYPKGGKWTYQFDFKGQTHSGKYFDTELEAAQAYDSHRFSVEGNTRKLNFPEEYTKGAN
ncbi:MAG: hypothetical protein ABS882_01390 [Lysinibacillus sp.]